MLLHSSSTPALNSLIGIQAESELNSLRFVQLTPLHAAGNGDSKWVHHDVQPRFRRTPSEADLHDPLSNACSRRLGLRRGSSSIDLCRNLSTIFFLSNGSLDEALGEEFEDSGNKISIGFQSTGGPHEESREKNMAGLGTHGGERPFVSGRRNEDMMCGKVLEGTRVALVCDRANPEMGSVNGGFGGEDGGGRGSGGGSGSDSNSTDAYYQKMLQADPGNPLLLTNYARFLQEVQHDSEKAEEYYGRAILASPGDGDVLSRYANLIWDVHKDAPRAESYYDQAIETAPDDCNVLGSYAHFLWSAEDNEENQDVSQQQKMASRTSHGTVTSAAT